MRPVAVLFAGLALLAGCAVEHTQTDLVSLKRADRDTLKDASNVATVTYAAPAPTRVPRNAGVRRSQHKEPCRRRGNCKCKRGDGSCALGCSRCCYSQQ